MIERKAYPTDLTNEQWSHLQILLPQGQGKGRRRSKWQNRELLNAILYVVRTGCQWRNLPHDFPAWQTVYGYYNKLCQLGVWEAINRTLGQGVRTQAGREVEASVVIVDSQSVKTTEKKDSVVASTAGNGSKDENDMSPLM
jgi:putative transposase